MELGLIIACIPPILLLIYVWYIDHIEREPITLIVKIFLLSAVFGTTAAAFIESVGEVLLDATGLYVSETVYLFVYFFFVVALAEEFCKRVVVVICAWKNPEFNYRFDAIVYCVASAIGFAVAENAMYIMTYGGDIALGRLIPVHTICAVFMGYYLGNARLCQARGDGAGEQANRALSFVVPIVIHGFWDFAVSSGFEALEWIAMVAIFALTIFAFLRIHKSAKEDVSLVVEPMQLYDPYAVQTTPEQVAAGYAQQPHLDAAPMLYYINDKGEYVVYEGSPVEPFTYKNAAVQAVVDKYTDNQTVPVDTVAASYQDK